MRHITATGMKEISKFYSNQVEFLINVHVKNQSRKERLCYLGVLIVQMADTLQKLNPKFDKGRFCIECQYNKTQNFLG